MGRRAGCVDSCRWWVVVRLLQRLVLPRLEGDQRRQRGTLAATSAWDDHPGTREAPDK